jgi:energy-coupling factor transporter ATP-binding protein EcfA2
MLLLGDSDLIDLGNGSSISGYENMNVILGRNGSGKSTILRLMDSVLIRSTACIRYITPERGGELTYDGNIETNRSNNPNWMPEVRRRNRFEQFRQSSVAEFRNLETLVLRSIEMNSDVRASNFTFDTELERINSVLERITLKRSASSGFEIFRRSNGSSVQPNELSSGESEIISLAVEILSFSYLCKQEKYANQENWLLIDEPDVHLHPDLQQRLMKLLVESMVDVNGRVMIATHSTSVLSSLCLFCPSMRIAFKSLDSNVLSFRKVDKPLRSILPMFGAHPLSSIFIQSPPLIVEGEDEERIWQTAWRSSQGRIKIYPCVAGDKQSMSDYENTANELMPTVYETAKSYSLRDRDGGPYEIGDLQYVYRFRLMCRTSENLILSDDVLDELDMDWESMKLGMEQWIERSSLHSRYQDATAFRDGGWDRKNFPMKNLRMIIISISGSNKTWETVVGRSIAKLNLRRFNGEHSLRSYLGPKIVDTLALES